MLVAAEVEVDWMMSVVMMGTVVCAPAAWTKLQHPAVFVEEVSVKTHVPAEAMPTP
jgi:hypothetical protein